MERVHPSNFLLSQIGKFREGTVFLLVGPRSLKNVNVYLVCQKLTQISMIQGSQLPLLPVLMYVVSLSIVYGLKLVVSIRTCRLFPGKQSYILSNMGTLHTSTHYSDLHLYIFVGFMAEISSPADISQPAALKPQS